MSLLFNMLFRLVITFLPRSKHLLISWLQSPSAVILEPRKIKSAIVSTVSPSICHEVMESDATILVFWMLSFKPAFSLSSFTFIKGLFSSSLSVVRVVSSAYLRLLIFSPAILIPACASSSPVFLTIYSAYKLNKQSDNIQPWHTPFPIWNQSVVLCPVLTFASWPAYRFLKRQVRWSGGSAGKESACNVGDLGSILGLGGSPGEWNGYPLQYLGLENSINECCPWITHKYSSPSFQFPPFYLEPSIYLVSPPELDREVDLQTRFLLLHSLAIE